MNAGITGKSMSGIIEKVKVLAEDGGIRDFQAHELFWGYRETTIRQKGYIVLATTFRLSKKPMAEIESEIKARLQHRKQTQPANIHTAGCVFKNPQNDSAGRIIDAVGLKGKSVGKVEVSSKHANFIINYGESAADALALIEAIKSEVKNKTGLSLELELVVLGE